jgi:photosystem II stability/assembly factor-like uncharacterized protein
MGARPLRRLLGTVLGVLLMAGCGGGPAGNPAGSGVWRSATSGTQARLHDVACLSASRCEAVGEAGTILSTADGGTTWRAQVDPLQGTSTVLYRIACVAPSSCYVIARPDTILVTHDGGASWTSHVLPVGVSGTALTDSACLLDYTPISGRSALCRLGLLDIACVNARVCYAVATTPPAYDDQPIMPATASAAASSVWATGDGGASWSRQSVPPGVACNGDCTEGRYGYPLVWVSCLGDGVCRAGGGHVLGCGHCGFAYAVLVTRGRGTQWACPQPAASCTTFSPDAGDCPSSTTCYGIQSTNPFGSGSSVDRSTDGGAQWVQAGQDWTTSVLGDIVCPATTTCYVAGSGGMIARITDGSNATVEPSPTTEDLDGIACPGPARCYAVGDRGTILVRR